MKIIAVARFTLLRLSRSRYFFAGAFIIGLLAAATFALGDLWVSTAQNLARMILWLMAIWLGISLVHADRADGTLRSTLTRPISLLEVIVGKLLGALAYLALVAAGFTVLLLLAAWHEGAAVSWRDAVYQLHLLPVHLTVMALAMMLAQFAPRFLAGIVALLAWDNFYTAESINRLFPKLSPTAFDIMHGVARVVHLVCPPTSTFYLSFKDFTVLHGVGGTYALLLVYAAHYALACCLLAAWALNRQEL
ncbi:MAG TPA: ABC transporter permease subunit [bacterium]|nr:ABC transporter permease subunit [bacterium]